MPTSSKPKKEKVALPKKEGTTSKGTHQRVKKQSADPPSPSTTPTPPTSAKYVMPFEQLSFYHNADYYGDGDKEKFIVGWIDKNNPGGGTGDYAHRKTTEGKELWEDFRDKFKGIRWMGKGFADSVHPQARKDLRDFLRAKGVFVYAGREAPIAQELVKVLQEKEQHVWSPAEIEQQRIFHEKLQRKRKALYAWQANKNQRV